MKKAIFILSFWLPVIVSAQSNVNISIEEVNRKICSNVQLLNDYIQFISDKSKALKTREAYYYEALNLFVANGEAYEEDFADRNGQIKKLQKEGANIEIFTQSNRTPTRRLVKDFLKAVMDFRYKSIKVSEVEILSNIEEDSLRKVTDELYVIEGWAEQEFGGYRNGNAVYKDITQKKKNLYLKVIETGNGYEIFPLFGNIKVIVS